MKYKEYYPAVIWLLAIAVVGLVTLLMDLPYLAIAPETKVRLPQSILQILLGLVSLRLMILLYGRYKTRRSDIALILSIYFLFTALSGLIYAVSDFIKFTTRNMDLFFTESAFLFLGAAVIYMELFTVKVFKESSDKTRNKIEIAAVTIGSVLFFYYIAKDILVQTDKTELIVFGLIIIVTFFYVYISLAVSSYMLTKKLEINDATRKGFILIGLSAVFNLSGAVTVWIYNIVKNMNETVDFIMSLLYSALLLIGYIMLYYGFTLPMKDREK